MTPMPELVCGTSDRAAWLAARSLGVTATDITAILGLNAHESAYSLWHRKRGSLPDRDDSDRLRLGRELKPIILNRWIQAGDNWRDYVRWGSGLYRSHDRPWQMATPDQALGPGTWLTGQPMVYVGVLELKSWVDSDRHAWGDTETGLIPPAVRAQVLWQMDVMSVTTGHVGVLFLPSGEFRRYVIGHSAAEHDDRDYAVEEDACPACEDLSLMVQAGREFWHSVQHGPPPSPDGSAATLAALRARWPAVAETTAEISPAAVKEWNQARQARDSWEDIMRACESQIREQAGDAKYYTVGGVKVATRVVFDVKVKAHTRHSDYLRAVKEQETDDA